MKYFSTVLIFFLISGFLEARDLKPTGDRHINKELQAIYNATKNGEVDKVKDLLDEGINPSIHFTGLGDNYRTLLHIAAEENHIDVIKLLKNRGVPLYITDEHGSTPLHYAAYNGQTDAVKELLRLGASVNAANDKGETPLDDAIRMKHPVIVKILRETANCLRPTGNRYEDSELSKIYNATIRGDVDEVKEGIDNGINPSIHFTGHKENERTLLHVASEVGQIPMIQLLADEGVNLDITDNYGSTPLHYAAYTGQINSIKELLGLGANVNAVNKGLTTPLHDAIRRNNVEVVQLLLEHGANVNGASSNDRYYEIPIVMAERNGNQEIQQLLIDHGASRIYRKISNKKM